MTDRRRRGRRRGLSDAFKRVQENESDEEHDDVEVRILGLVCFGEEFLGDEIEKCGAPKGENCGQHSAARVPEERSSTNRADHNGERRADRHKHGLAFRGAALQELGGERKSEEEYLEGERDGEGAVNRTGTRPRPCSTSNEP